MTEAIPTPARKVLAPTAVRHTAEYDAPRFHVRVDDDVTLEDIMRPAFWAHHAKTLRPFNVVEIVRQNMSLDMEVRVLEVGTGYVVVRPLRFWEDKAVADARAQAVAAADAGGADVVLPAEYKITSGRGSFVLTFIPNDTKLGSAYKSRAAAIVAAREHAAKAGIAWPETLPATEPVDA